MSGWVHHEDGGEEEEELAVGEVVDGHDDQASDAEADE